MIQADLQAHKQVEEIDHYLFLLQDLVWKILKDAENIPSLMKRFGEFFKKGYPEGLQLPRAYLALIAHLLNLDLLPLHLQQFPNGTALIDTEGLCESRQIPEPTELAQLGVIWMILGVRLKNETLQRAGLKIAMWHLHLLDGNGIPHFSIWSRASSFRPSIFALWSYALFTLAYRLTGENKFQHLAEVSRSQFWDPHAFAVELLILVPSTMPPSIPNVFHPFAEEMTVGMVKFSNPEMSFAAQISGWNSGLFSFHKKEVFVLNAGPQIEPSDNLNQFGIRRVWGVKYRPFQELIWEKTTYHCRLKGWTQLAAAPLWLESDTRFQAGHLIFEATLQEKPRHDQVTIVLFLKSDNLIVGGKHHLEIGTLESYEGRALALELRGPSEKMVIHPTSSLSMKVTPLAGGDYFWGAHFLVSFPMEVGNSLRLELK